MKSNSCVLIVEDDIQSNENLQRLLAENFDTVIGAYNGLEGWNLFRSHQPNIVITDIDMPKMDGLELVRKIRSINSDCFIAVLTSYSDQHHLMRAVSLKLDGYLLKPITSSKLNTLIQDIRSAQNLKAPHYIVLTSSTLYDTKAKLIIQDGIFIALSNREIDLLEVLIKNRNDVTTYEMIDYALDYEKENSRNAIKILISHLRKKANLTIQSIPKVGYLLA